MFVDKIRLKDEYRNADFYLRRHNPDYLLADNNYQIDPCGQFSSGTIPKGIFYFRSQFGIGTAGWLIFRFRPDATTTSIYKAYHFLCFLVSRYGVAPHRIKYAISESAFVALFIPSSAFRQRFSGTYLPIVLRRMLDHLAVESNACFDRDIYDRGIFSEIEFPGHCIGGVEAVKYYEYDAFIQYAQNNGCDTTQCPPRSGNDTLESLYKRILSVLFEHIMLGNTFNCSLGTGLDTSSTLGFVTQKCNVVYAMMALKQIIIRKKPTKAYLVQRSEFFRICRCFGERGRQAAYALAELSGDPSPSLSKDSPPKDWFHLLVIKPNQSPTLCEEHRENKICKKKHACGVRHPAELGYRKTTELFSSPIAFYDNPRANCCYHRLVRFLNTNDKEYIYIRDLQRRYCGSFAPDALNLAVLHAIGKGNLIPVYPEYTHSRGKSPSQLYQIVKEKN